MTSVPPVGSTCWMMKSAGWVLRQPTRSNFAPVSGEVGRAVGLLVYLRVDALPTSMSQMQVEDP